MLSYRQTLVVCILRLPTDYLHPYFGVLVLEGVCDEASLSALQKPSTVVDLDTTMSQQSGFRCFEIWWLDPIWHLS